MMKKRNFHLKEGAFDVLKWISVAFKLRHNSQHRRFVPSKFTYVIESINGVIWSDSNYQLASANRRKKAATGKWDQIYRIWTRSFSSCEPRSQTEIFWHDSDEIVLSKTEKSSHSKERCNKD